MWLGCYVVDMRSGTLSLLEASGAGNDVLKQPYCGQLTQWVAVCGRDVSGPVPQSGHQAAPVHGHHGVERRPVHLARQ